MLRPRFSVGDLVVLVALVLGIGVTGLICRAAMLADSDRARCAANLHQWGLAIILYQNDNNQAYPRTIAAEKDGVPPVWGTPYKADPKLGPLPEADASPFKGDVQPKPNDVTAALFLLFREEQLGSAVGTCPSAGQNASNFGGGDNKSRNWTNFPGDRSMARHLSYSFENNYADTAAIARGFNLKNPDATFAVMADMNPGGDAVTKVTPDSSADDMRKANSLNHGGAGQNVLYGDGHADWESTPFCGTEHDNIYTAAGPEIRGDGRGTAVIVASPVDGADSILLPTSADIGYHNVLSTAESADPLTATEHDALVAKLVGKYHVKGNDDATMTIDDGSINNLAGANPETLSYDIIWGSADAVVCTFTANGESARGVIYLDKDGMEFAIPGAGAGFDYQWVKVGAAK